MRFLDELAREFQEFESYENQWPSNWTIEEIEERIDQHYSTLEEAESKGLYRIGDGGFRVVFEIKTSNQIGLPSGSVLKVSKYNGTKQNADAVQIHKSLSGDAQSYVASIKDWDSKYKWIIQDKANPAKPGDTSDVREKLSECGYSCSDLRKENCGRICGEPVLTDLGLLR